MVEWLGGYRFQAVVLLLADAEQWMVPIASATAIIVGVGTRHQVLALSDVASATRTALTFSARSALFIIIANFHIIMRGRMPRQCPPAVRHRHGSAFQSVIYLSSTFFFFAQTINIKLNYSLCLRENPRVINACPEISARLDSIGFFLFVFFFF